MQSHSGVIVEYPNNETPYRFKFVCECNWQSYQPTKETAEQIGLAHQSNWGYVNPTPEPAPQAASQKAAPASTVVAPVGKVN